MHHDGDPESPVLTAAMCFGGEEVVEGEGREVLDVTAQAEEAATAEAAAPVDEAQQQEQGQQQQDEQQQQQDEQQRPHQKQESDAVPKEETVVVEVEDDEEEPSSPRGSLMHHDGDLESPVLTAAMCFGGVVLVSPVRVPVVATMQHRAMWSCSDSRRARRS